MVGDRARAAARWVATVVVVALLVWGMIRLSQWQWRKHVARDAELARIDANRRNGVVPFTQVVPATGTVGQREQWRLVSVTGTWDPAHQVIARLRTVIGTSGFEVLTPVRTADGAGVLVDRGLLPVTGSDTQRPASVPAPPAGTVTVSGYLRIPESGGQRPVAGLVRRIDPALIAPTLPYPVLDGYVQLTSAQPADAAGFLLLPPPSQDTGPYLSYSVQWVVFAAIAVGGLGFLAVDELRGGRLRARLRQPPQDTAPAAGPPRPDPPATDPPPPDPPATDPRPASPVPPRPAASRRRRPAVLAGDRRGGADLPAGFWDDDGRQRRRHRRRRAGSGRRRRRDGPAERRRRTVTDPPPSPFVPPAGYRESSLE